MIVKVCGMRQGQNIREVEALGPDMMGFICWQGSKRHVAAIPDYLPQVCRVGVFVDPALDYVASQVQSLGLGRIQLHGAESPAFCAAVAECTGLPVIKAISVSQAADLRLCEAYEAVAAVDMFLFDTKCKTVGGSGEQFDWSVLSSYSGRLPFLLSGGIGPGDEARVLAFSHPRFAGIDLNSRFESAPALKDVTKLSKFIKTIRHEQNQ